MHSDFPHILQNLFTNLTPETFRKMAALSLGNSTISPMCFSFVTVLFIFSFHSILVSSFEYQVGGSKGWIVPRANDTGVYNDWASKKRFRVGDTISFKYKKDSVMEVTEEDYKKCNSTHPRFFSNNGSTVFRLENSGSFYFISGMTGHCERGQKMIIRVIAQDEDDESSSSSFASPAAVLSVWLFLVLLFQSIFSLVACYML